MPIPMWWTSEAKIPNLDFLLSSLRSGPGKIVEYRRMASAIFFSQTTPHLEWVPEGSSRLRASLPHVKYCLLAGWWSPMGMMGNFGIIFDNLCGGVNVTALFRENQPGPNDPDMVAMLRERKRQQRLFLVGLPIGIALIGFITIKYLI